jgi:Tfp pilus assembly protein PilV
VAEADSAASWRVSVHHTGANTLVTVQRQTWPPAAVRYFGDPVVVARIPQDSPGYEVELDRASTTARQRATQLNRLREEVPQ